MTGIKYILGLRNDGQGPCGEAISWVRSLRPKRASVKRIWNECPRADWLVWWLDAIDGWDDKQRRLFAVDCAMRSLKCVDSPDGRSLHACAVATAFAHGQATPTDLAAAMAAAMAAAGVAAWAAAWAAAGDAAWAAGDAARAAAGAAEHKAQCDWIRDHVRVPKP
jgi:hypothetical protein